MLATEGSNLQLLFSSDICLDHHLKCGLRNLSMKPTPAYSNVLNNAEGCEKCCVM